MSPTKVNPGEGVGEGGASEVRCLLEVGNVLAVNAICSSKLVIFKIYGILLDCGPKVEKNPNSTIRASVQTGRRRVVFRPGLIQFLSQCFMEFTVAFWGGKSESYMEDVVAVMLTRLKEWMKVDLLFVWSGKQCEGTGFEDEAVVSWGKPLTKVFEQWPMYGVTNTIIVDHKGFRVGCNSQGNVIITTPFYVHRIGKLGEDGNYLKASLWSLLEGFSASSDVLSFCEHFPSSFLGP
jgi:hypothetical protein